MSALSSGSITPAMLSGKKFYIIADVTIGGVQFFMATSELEILWDAGDKTIPVSHYLNQPIEVTIDAGWGKVENTPTEATIEVPLVGRILDLRNNGAFDYEIGCEVFIWVEGTDYTEREVLVSGSVRLVQFGASGEVAVINVSQDLGNSTANIKSGVIDNSFATLGGGYAVEENLGRQYPIVFGPVQSNSATRPDKVNRSEAIAYSRSTGTPSTNQRVVIAGHLVQAEEVTVYDSEGGSDTLAVTYRQDGTGYKFATINLVGSALSVDEGVTYTVKWSTDFGALVDEGIVLTGAGHLISYLMNTSGVKVNSARLAGARIFLDAYQVAGTIQEPVGAIEYIKDAIGSTLPFTMTVDPFGWWPWPWPLSPSSSNAVAEINPDLGDAVRSSEFELDNSSVINDVVFDYGYDVSTGNMLRTLSVGGESSGTILSSCVDSQRIYGIRSESFESICIESQGSASRAINSRLAAFAEPKGRVSYDLSTSLAWLRPRHIVTISDRDVNAYGVAVVDKLTISELGSNISVIILVRTEQ